MTCDSSQLPSTFLVYYLGVYKSLPFGPLCLFTQIMVKTRAQRGQGLMTPSPKLVTQKSTTGSKSVTRKSTRGTELKCTGPHERPAETPRTTKKELKTDKSANRTRRTSMTRRHQDTKTADDDEEEEDSYGDDVSVSELQSKQKQTKKNVNSGTTNDRAMSAAEDAAEEYNINGNDREEEDEEEMEKENEEDTRNDRLSISSIPPQHSSLEAGTSGEASKSDALNLKADESDHQEEEDDDAPEDVSFSRSRHDALEFMSQALQQSRRSEERAKEKRRNRDKLLKLQKERKKISLQDSRLPEDFLSELSKLPTVERGSQVLSAAPTAEEDQSDPGDDMDIEEDDDFIPFSSDGSQVVDGFEVRAMSRERRAPPPKSDVALAFLQKQLYGQTVRRESVKKRISRLLKRKGKPGLVFINPNAKARGRKKKHRVVQLVQ